MTEDQIKYMANRFLGWPLPKNFFPDCGITFEPKGNKGTQHEYDRNPQGTNLFDYTQAEAMVRHMVEGLPERARLSAGVEMTDAEICDVATEHCDSPQPNLTAWTFRYTGMLRVARALIAEASARATAAERERYRALIASEETGWLIERASPTGPTWYSVTPYSRWQHQTAMVPVSHWTSNASKAVRFARKQDAEDFIKYEGIQHAFASEHAWVEGPSAAAHRAGEGE